MNSKNFVRIVAYAVRNGHAWADALIYADLKTIKNKEYKFFISTMRAFLTGHLTWDKMNEKKLLSVVDTPIKQKALLRFADDLLEKEDRDIRGLMAQDEFCEFDSHDRNENDDLHYDHRSVTNRTEIYAHEDIIELKINRPNQQYLFNLNLIQEEDSNSITPFYYGDEYDEGFNEYPTSKGPEFYQKFSLINQVRYRHLASISYNMEMLMFFKEDKEVVFPIFKQLWYSTGLFFLENTHREIRINYCSDSIELVEDGLHENQLGRVISNFFDDEKMDKPYSIEDSIIEIEYDGDKWRKYFTEFESARKVLHLPVDGIPNRNKKVILVFELRCYSKYAPLGNSRDVDCYVVYGTTKDQIIKSYNDLANSNLKDAIDKIIDPISQETGAFCRIINANIRYDDPKKLITKFNEIIKRS